MPLALLDFFNSREDAILLWTLLLVGYPLYKDPRGIGGALLHAARAALHPKLVLLYGSALGYASLLVYGAHKVGLWHTTAVKATAYWFAGTAIVLIADAVTRAEPRDRAFIRRVLRRVAGITILIGFAVNLYAFPFAVEVAGVGIAVTFSMLQAVMATDPSADPRVRRFVDGTLAAVAFAYVSYLAVRGIGDLLDGVGRERTEEFLVGPALTIALIPFLYAVAWWSRREKEQIRKRFQARRRRADETWSDERIDADRAA
jgi:hypothetical protein